MGTGLLADPAVLVPIEEVLVEHAVADCDGAARAVVVVVARVLPCTQQISQTSTFGSR